MDLPPILGSSVLFLTHFILVSWALLGAGLSQSFFMTNFVLVFVLLFVTIDDASSARRSKAIELIMMLYIFTIVNDVICLGLFGEDSTDDSTGKFSIACACFNLLAKIIYLLLIIKNKLSNPGSESFENKDVYSDVPEQQY